MNKNSLFEKSKKLRAAKAHLDNVSRINPYIGPFPLEEPYTNGWIRDFRLRFDIENRKDADAFRYVLSLLNNSRFCRDKSFREKTWKGVYKDIGQGLNSLSVDQFDRLTSSGAPYRAFLLKYFAKREVEESCYSFTWKRTRFVFLFPWAFEFRIRRHRVTEEYRLDRNAVKEEADAKKEFENAGGWSRYYYEFHGRGARGDDWSADARLVKHAKAGKVSKLPSSISRTSLRLRLKDALRDEIEEYERFSA